MPKQASVQLALCLKKPRPQGPTPALRRRLRELGMTLSGVGSATLSVRMAPVEFKRLFAVSPEREADALTVPRNISRWVERIDVSPQHIRLKRNAE